MNIEWYKEKARQLNKVTRELRAFDSYKRMQDRIMASLDKMMWEGLVK